MMKKVMAGGAQSSSFIRLPNEARRGAEGASEHRSINPSIGCAAGRANISLDEGEDD